MISYHTGRTSIHKAGTFAVATVLALVLGLWIAPASAQDAVDLLTNGLPGWQPGQAVTTSIKDALPQVNDLKGIDPADARPIPADWIFTPGYYRGEVRTYCLHAGSYGPTTGDGYLIAPLKGNRAPLIQNILLRSEQNPSVGQQDVQRLIWGVEAGTPWTSYEAEFRTRAAPLVTQQEINIMNQVPQKEAVVNNIKSRLGGLIPGRVQNAVDTYSNIRNSIASTPSYNDLENIAVKTGAAPWGKDSLKNVKPGPWAYAGNGFFIRVFPSDYTTTTMEIYKVAPGIIRDDMNRIVHFNSVGHTIDATYDNTPATRIIDGRNVQVWNFKTLTFKHPDGRVFTIENKGYVEAGPDKQVLLLNGP